LELKTFEIFGLDLEPLQQLLEMSRSGGGRRTGPYMYSHLRFPLIESVDDCMYRDLWVRVNWNSHQETTRKTCQTLWSGTEPENSLGA